MNKEEQLREAVQLNTMSSNLNTLSGFLGIILLMIVLLPKGFSIGFVGGIAIYSAIRSWILFKKVRKLIESVKD